MPQRRSRAAQSLLVVCFCTVVGCLLATAGDFLSQGKRALAAGKYEEAAKMFERITASDEFVEFLTLPAYETIA